MKAERVVDLERYRRLKEKGRITPRAAVVKVEMVESSVASSLSGASPVVPSFDSSNESGRIPIASPYIKESTQTSQFESAFGCTGANLLGQTVQNESPFPTKSRLLGKETTHGKIHPVLSQEETVRRKNTAPIFDKDKRERYERFKNKVRNATSPKSDPPGTKNKKGLVKKNIPRGRKQLTTSLNQSSSNMDSNGPQYDKYDSFEGIPSPPSNLLSVASPQPVHTHRLPIASAKHNFKSAPTQSLEETLPAKTRQDMESYQNPFLQQPQRKGKNQRPTRTQKKSSGIKNLPSFGDNRRESKPVPDHGTMGRKQAIESSPLQRQQLTPESRRQRQGQTEKKQQILEENQHSEVKIKHHYGGDLRQQRGVQKTRRKPNLVVNPSSTPTSTPPSIIFESFLDSQVPSPPMRPPISNKKPLRSFGSSEVSSRSSKRDRILESRGVEEDEYSFEKEERGPLNEIHETFTRVDSKRVESPAPSLQMRQSLEMPSLGSSHSQDYQQLQWADPKPPRQARGTTPVEFYQRLSAEKSKQAALVKQRINGGGVADPIRQSHESKRFPGRATQNCHSESPQLSTNRRNNQPYTQTYPTESPRSSENGERTQTSTMTYHGESPKSSKDKRQTPRVAQKHHLGSPRGIEDKRYTPRGSQIYRFESPRSVDAPMLDQRTVRLLYSAEFLTIIREKKKNGLHELLKNTMTRESLNCRQHNGVFFATRKRPLMHDELARGEFDIIETQVGRPDSLVVFKTSLLSDRKSKNVEPSVHFFDHVCSGSEPGSAEDFYRQIIKPGILRATDGGTSAVIVFGSDGSGKTHTMADIEEQAANDLFRGSHYNMHFEKPMSVLIQYLEISDSHIVDLLGPVGNFVRIIEEEEGYNFKGAVVKTASCSGEFLDILSDAKRRLARTKAIRKKQDECNYLLCQIEVHYGWGHGSLTLLECPTENISNGNQPMFDGLMNSIRVRSSGRIQDNPFRGVNNVTKALQFIIEDSSSEICLVATVSPAATCTENTIATLSCLSSVMNGQQAEGLSGKESPKFAQQENISPQNFGRAEELALPRQWSHEELVKWMQRKNLLGNPVPSDVNGRFAMRMSKRQLKNTFYDVLDDKMAEKLFIALRAENDRVARQRVKLRMARDRQRLSASY